MAERVSSIVTGARYLSHLPPHIVQFIADRFCIDAGD